MKKMFRFSILEMMVVIAIILILISIVMPILNVVQAKAKRTKTFAAVKSIGLIMISYAEDDTRANKMPYPLPRGEEKAWGNSKACWSTSVAELLFSLKYMRLGEEGQLRSAGITGSEYEPMTLDDNTINKNKFWGKDTNLDYHLYCEKTLTSNVSGKLILVATYDNDDFRQCQFEGAGWVVFFADKTTEFVSRANARDYDPDATPPVISLDETDKKLPAASEFRDKIDAAKGGPGTFGKGGGSTEIMGKRDSDAVYKALIR